MVYAMRECADLDRAGRSSFDQLYAQARCCRMFLQERAQQLAAECKGMFPITVMKQSKYEESALYVLWAEAKEDEEMRNSIQWTPLKPLDQVPTFLPPVPHPRLPSSPTESAYPRPAPFPFFHPQHSPSQSPPSSTPYDGWQHVRGRRADLGGDRRGAKRWTTTKGKWRACLTSAARPSCSRSRAAPARVRLSRGAVPGVELTSWGGRWSQEVDDITRCLHAVMEDREVVVERIKNTLVRPSLASVILLLPNADAGDVMATDGGLVGCGGGDDGASVGRGLKVK